MMNKVELIKSLIFTVLICLLAWDVLQYLTGKLPALPQSHKQILATGVLIWFVSLFYTKDSDDDWAGQW